MSQWVAKELFPSLSGAKLISIDLETKDPELLEKGPGSFRKDGFICGFSVGTDDGFKAYYPIRHASGNMPDPEKAKRWLKEQMLLDIPKVGANILYDMEWLRADWGIEVRGLKYDVQVAAPLLDENYQSYSLNSLAKRVLGVEKEETLLYEAGITIFGMSCKKDVDDKEKRAEIIKKVKGRLSELPAHLVGPYGEADAALPIEIFKVQEKQLHDAGLWPIFLLECDVLELLFDMRFKGVKVDIAKAERVRDEMKVDYDILINQLKQRTGIDVDIWANESLVSVYDKLGLPYEKTNKGNPSFTADFLASQENQVSKLILEARQLDRSGSVFIQSKIIDLATDGKIHPSFWQVKGERGGTVSGRFASSNPNAQQFPARNEKLAKRVRSILVAEDGCQFGVFDYSQQEPRVTVHYAALLDLPGAYKARDQYRNNPDTDYHQMVSDWTEIDRKIAKSINLGLAYGMGPKKFSEKYGKTLAEARQLFALYHEKLPFIRELSNRCENMVKQRGYIRTLLGRHCHFNLYGPREWKAGLVPKRLDEAIKEFGAPVVQYFTYKAMNRLIQGGSADMIKQAMVNCKKAGYIPSMTVHDELDFSDIQSEKQIKEIREIMLTAIPLQVPLKVDVELGPNWGEMTDVTKNYN